MMKFLINKTILITGGTGSFGKAFVKKLLLSKINYKKIIIFSRDEFKQFNQKNFFKSNKNFKKLRFFLGDVRDKDRLKIALKEVDILIHAAALKQIDTAEYNPTEFIDTNIIGTQNIIECCSYNNVKKAILVSTDKACAPANLYGATKLCSEKVFLSANNYLGKKIFSVVRYGNVFASRGSVFPLFMEQRKKSFFSITDERMTRFNIFLNEAVELILWSLVNSKLPSITVPKMSSYRVVDLAKTVDPKKKIKLIGIRPGEKIHEQLIHENEPYMILEFKKYYMLIDKHHDFQNKIKFKERYKIKNFCFDYNSGLTNNLLDSKNLKTSVSTYLKDTK